MSGRRATMLRQLAREMSLNNASVEPLYKALKRTWKSLGRDEHQAWLDWVWANVHEIRLQFEDNMRDLQSIKV